MSVGARRGWPGRGIAQGLDLDASEMVSTLMSLPASLYDLADASAADIFSYASPQLRVPRCSDTSRLPTARLRPALRWKSGDGFLQLIRPPGWEKSLDGSGPLRFAFSAVNPAQVQRPSPNLVGGRAVR
jgi:hypothetical protein